MVWDVFVYGTLRRGFCNHGWLGRAAFCGTAQTVAACCLYLEAGIPYLAADEARYPVVGEVYRVTDARTLAGLDALEEHPRVYERRQTAVVMDDGGEIRTAWVYFARRTPGVAAATGDFAALSRT